MRDMRLVPTPVSTVQDLTVGDVDRIDGITGALVVLVEQQRTALAAGLQQLAHLRYGGRAGVLHTCICTPRTRARGHTLVHNTQMCMQACLHMYVRTHTHNTLGVEQCVSTRQHCDTHSECGG